MSADLDLPPPISEQPQATAAAAADDAAAAAAAAVPESSVAEQVDGSSASNGNLADTLVNTAKQAMDTVGNHPVTQSAKDTVVNGPVGQSVQKETAKTSSEFKDLAAARQTPDTPAATGQPLTHYHSMFYRLLSWKNPRATTITFLATVAFIFAARYLNVIRYTFKALYLVLGVTAASEVAGRLVLGEGIATKLRPKKYFVIPKESLERLLDDVEQLINFFVIEFQRVVFAENIWATFLAFISSFISYWLIKWLPLWGLALIFDVFLFIGPLIYIKNQAIIDQHLSHAKEVASAQASQVREIAAQHTGRATESLKGYTSEYTKKAQEMIGQARGKASGVQASDLPNAPKDEPVAKASEPEPVPAL